MNHVDFSSALIRLNRHQIGITEACVLFALGDGSTHQKIAKTLSTDNSTIKARIGVLKRKGLCLQSYDDNGRSTYKPTLAGEKIIWQTLKQKQEP